MREVLVDVIDAQLVFRSHLPRHMSRIVSLLRWIYCRSAQVGRVQGTPLGLVPVSIRNAYVLSSIHRPAEEPELVLHDGTANRGVKFPQLINTVYSRQPAIAQLR